MKVDALVDSGAVVSMMLEDLCKRLPNVSFYWKDDSEEDFEGLLKGSKLHVEGSVELPVWIGTFTSAPHRWRVIKDSNHDCILGLDFLDCFFISINTSD